MSWNSRFAVCPGSAALMVTGSGPPPGQARYEVREPNEGTHCAAPGRAGRTDPAPLWASEQTQAEGTRVAGTAWTRGVQSRAGRSPRAGEESGATDSGACNCPAAAKIAPQMGRSCARTGLNWKRSEPVIFKAGK